VKRGKVRDIYELMKYSIAYLLMVTTDRLSAFDVVLPNGIPGKGKVLNKISIFWFEKFKDIVDSHVVTDDITRYPDECSEYWDQLSERSVIVVKGKIMPVECIVRGYLSGSGWKEYKEKSNICGIKLPPGLVESDRLEEPIFTPSTKAEKGHDININFDEMVKIVGGELAEKMRDISLKIYKKGRAIAGRKGIIIADTKFEFALYNEELMLVDEVFTPDSSRFWDIKTHQPGRSQDSYDKQIVRDYLLTLDWNKTYPGPILLDEIVKKTAQRYQDILRILTA
jgi:phosphoribosylaminoimidazole-succinocarboxamide synthase